MTPHISAQKEDIASIVIMPGDPLRAKYIASTYLTDIKQVNSIRNNLAYTGKYKNKKVTVFSSGMGMGSMGIYAYELFTKYDVEKIIRIGSCGSYYEEIKVGDLILVEKSYTESSFAYQDKGKGSNICSSSPFLNQKLIKQAHDDNITLKIGNIYSTDVFYNEWDNPKIKENYCLGVEMESFALFYIAKKLRKDASCILTVSDNLITKEEMTSEEREKNLNNAIKLTLDSINIK